MRRARLILVVAVLVALLAAPAAAGARGASPAARGCHARWPVHALRAGPGTTHPAHVRRLPLACGVRTGYATSETTLAVTRSGAILFSPARSENTLARSTDGGRRWSLVGPSVLQHTNLWNTDDPQVVIDPRTGRLFWVHTTHAVGIDQPLPGQSPADWLVPLAVADARGFQVFSSVNRGRSWHTANYSQANTADWEKLFVGPPRPAASGVPQPHGYPDVVYMCANAPQEVIGPGRACYRSLDGGASFTNLGFEVPSASSPVFCPPLAANTGVVSRTGIVYIPQSCLSGSYLAISSNEGKSFSWVRVPGAPATNGLGANVQLAIDSAGNLYLLWLGSSGLQLVISRDGGENWSHPLSVSPPQQKNIALPALAAGRRGHIGIVYYANTGAAGGALNGYVSETMNALARRPLFYLGTVNNPRHPIFHNYGQSHSPRADFIGAAYGSRGGVWGGMVDQLRPPDSAGRVATSGYVGRLVFRRP